MLSSSARQEAALLYSINGSSLELKYVRKRRCADEDRPQNAPKRLSSVHRAFDLSSELVEGKCLTWWAL
jgi:hypothetical protein